jgi:hypothetical protein
MLIPLLALAFVGTTDVPELQRGSALYRQCQASVKAIDEPDSPMYVFASAALCSGYIDGFADGLEMGGHGVCLAGASLGTLARVYVAYMQKNPKMMDVEKSVGLLNALLDNYPCRSKK